MNFNNTAGIANTMATSGELLLSGEMDSNGLQTKGAASTSLGNFPTLMEWPSMNNLVVAAETMKSVDDLESLGKTEMDKRIRDVIQKYLSKHFPL
jgi:hypothetical protein